MLSRWLKVFRWNRSSCWKLVSLLSGLGVKRGGSLVMDLLGVIDTLPRTTVVVERVVRRWFGVDCSAFVGITTISTVVGHWSSSSSSSPLPNGCTSFSQLKLKTGSAPQLTGKRPSSGFSTKMSPQLSADGLSFLNIKTVESGAGRHVQAIHHLCVGLPPKSPYHLCSGSAKID